VSIVLGSIFVDFGQFAVAIDIELVDFLGNLLGASACGKGDVDSSSDYAAEFGKFVRVSSSLEEIVKL
jgi:hypothetical protein